MKIEKNPKKPKRYDNLFRLVKEIRAAKILEVGTWNGMHAKRMIKTAQQFNSIVRYWGFDVFEKIEQETKTPPSMSVVYERLITTGADITLIKGDTRDTMSKLMLTPMDFIFIDGGHTIEIIRNDWEFCKNLMREDTVVVFDDYWNHPKLDGCNQVIDSLSRDHYNITILEPQSHFTYPWGLLKTNMVKVTKCKE